MGKERVMGKHKDDVDCFIRANHINGMTKLETRVQVAVLGELAIIADALEASPQKSIGGACATCRFWRPLDSLNGTCEVSGSWRIMAVAKTGLPQNSIRLELVTEEGFGCIHWSPREAH